MNVLFLTIGLYDSIYQKGGYGDLLRCFAEDGHSVYAVVRRERRTGLDSELVNEGIAKTLKVKVGNITKTRLIEKGISILLIGHQYKKAIEKYYKGVRFDLIIYTTPPITLVNLIKYIKKRDKCRTYLLLKDIFPQNAVDIGLMSKNGIEGIIYRYFRSKERKLYNISDQIGCMSPANVEYVLRHNHEVDPLKVTVCPNCIEVEDKRIDESTKVSIRNKYGIPLKKKLFIYGGNLGKPQGIEFVIKCIRSQRMNNEIYFLIIGDGTEFKKLEEFTLKHPQNNLKLMKKIPKEDYGKMVAASDVGMIFLDCRFTVPNFPSRILDYLTAGVPVFACTDDSTDMGKIIVSNGFGWWCKSDDIRTFDNNISLCVRDDLKIYGNRGFEYLKENYDASKVYKKMIS